MFRRLSVAVLSLLALAACGDDPDPAGVVIGLPETLGAVSIATPKGTPSEAVVSVRTIAGRTLSVSVVAEPSNGTVEITQLSTGVRVRYTPNPGFAGQDQVTFRVSDGVSSADGRVDITVVNAVPTATDVFLRRPALTSFSFEVSGTDPDGDPLTFQVADGPDGGTLSGFAAPAPGAGPSAVPATTTAQVTYTPNPGFLGDETFSYRATDGDDASEPATVTLVANRFPEVEVAGGLPVEAGRNAPVRVSLSVSDPDGDEVTVELATPPEHGTLGALEPTRAGVDIFYTPTSGYAGDDGFTLFLDDGFDRVPFEVEVTVVNQAPVAFNVTRAGFVGSDLLVELTGSDPDDDALTFEIVSAPSAGTLGSLTSTGPATAQVIYTPGSASAGTRTFTYRVSDGLSFSAPATVTLLLESEAPIATGTTAATPEDTPVVITLAGLDQQGDALTFAVVSGPTHGSLGAITNLGPNSAQVTYTPDPDYSGPDLFAFTVSDGGFTSSPASVAITVTPVNDPPTVVASPVETFTTHGNTTLQLAAARTIPAGVFVTGTLRANFVDAEGDPLAVSLVPASVTAGAVVTVALDGTFTYTPPPGRTADDTFDYTVTDGATPVTRTVTISFATPLWFVDDTFGGTATGTSAAPFTTLGAASAASGPGDIVFVRTGNSGTTPLGGGFVFQAGQQLVGEPEGLTTALGLVVAAAAGPRPVITNAAGAGVTLADGSVLRGFDIAGPTGAGVAASTVTGATLDEVAITGAGGAGIDLDAPAGIWSLTSVSVSGAAGAALDIDGGSPTLTSDGSIGNTAGRSVEISGLTGGSVTLSGSISDSGSGILVDGNTGGSIVFSGPSKVLSTGANDAVVLSNNTGATVDFTGGGLDIDVTAGAGFSATGGGTITVQGAGNSVAATTGTPVTVAATTIGAAGVTFQRVDADGAANGIVIDGTGTGVFTVTGTGTASGSGGTITNTSGHGVVLNAASGVTLRNLVVGDPTAAVGQTPDGVNAVGGSGVVATDVSGLSLQNVLVSRTAGHGVDGTRVTGLLIADSRILNAGDGAGDDALHFGAAGGPDGLFGTATVSNTTLDGFARAGLAVRNGSGSLSLTVSGGSFSNNQGGVATGVGTDGLLLAPSGTASMTVALGGVNNFTLLRGSGVAIDASGGSIDATVSGASFDDVDSGAGAVSIVSSGGATGRVAVENNTILRAAGSGVYVVEAGSSTLDVGVRSNTVGQAGVAGSGAQSANGITLVHAGTGLSRFEASNNALNSHSAAGIFSLNLEAGAADGTDSHVVLAGNLVAAPESGAFLGGIQMATSGEHVLCTSITGNTATGSGGAPGIEVQQATVASVFGIVGLGATPVDVYLASVNAATAGSAGGSYVDAGVPSCAAPTAPATP